MKLSAYHKARGDSVEWWRPEGRYDLVYKSRVFTDLYSKDTIAVTNAERVVCGGTGYGKPDKLPDEVEHTFPDYGLYPQFSDTAYGFLTRGCPRGCGFCHVASKEGRCSYKVANLDEFWKGQKKIVLSDPNILACPDHKDLLMQLADSKASVEFNQGLDIRMVTDENLELLRNVNLQQIHFAFDRWEDKDIIVPRLRAFKEATGYDRGKGKVMVYILCNYDTTLEQDLYRIQLCRELNFSPYPMIYDKAHADPVYRQLQRWCNNWIFWGVPTFDEYRAM